jgi:signal recognition particle receptor subunit beta
VSTINFHTKEIGVKIVYYGPGLCGKTTTLHAVYKSIPEHDRPQLVSLATEVDRTIFFDFLPVTAYRIRDFKVRLQLYTVPGQVFYNATRKLVLNGVDGIVFVLDSQRAMHDSNLESLQNLADNLGDLGMDVSDVPTVIQANKRDAPDVMSLEDVDRNYNQRKLSLFATVAINGEGVLDGLRTITQLVINNLLRKGLGNQIQGESAAARPVEGLSASLAQAAASLPQSAAGDGWWPGGQATSLGRQLESLLRTEKWGDAVLATDVLIKHLAEKWASTAHYNRGDPVAAFFLLRGVSGSRYRTFVKSLTAARAGQQVSREDAMSALCLALQSAW